MEKAQKLDKVLLYLYSNKDFHNVSVFCEELPYSEEETRSLIDHLENYGLVESISAKGVLVAEITTQGQIFLNEGGFAKDAEEKRLQSKKLRQEVKNGKYSLPLSIAALIVSLLALLVSIFGSPDKQENNRHLNKKQTKEASLNEKPITAPQPQAP